MRGEELKERSSEGKLKKRPKLVGNNTKKKKTAKSELIAKIS